MKVLFLSVTSGQGHNSTARAVMCALDARGVECTMLDTFRYINKAISFSLDKGYVQLTRFTPSVWGKLYDSMDKSEPLKSSESIYRLFQMLPSQKLVKFISDYAPDAIVCSHVFPAMIVHILQMQQKIDPKILTLGIVTDYTLHPLWEKTQMDYIVTGSELLDYSLEKRGISKEHILSIGIPVDPAFTRHIEKAQARKVLGIDEERRTLFMMSGSMGFGNAVGLLRQLDKVEQDFQIIVVCGNNRTAFERVSRLSQESAHTVLPYGYTDQVPTMMAASDLVLSKPGGLSTSEAVAAGIPLVLLPPIPGLEERNLQFFLNCGMAVSFSERVPIDEVVTQLFAHPERMELMREAQHRFGKPDAAEKLCAFLVDKIGHSKT